MKVKNMQLEWSMTSGSLHSATDALQVVQPLCKEDIGFLQLA